MAYFWLGVIWLLARAGHVSPALRTHAHLIASVLCLSGIWPRSARCFGAISISAPRTKRSWPVWCRARPSRASLPWLVEPQQIFRLDAALRERELCYYARDGYGSIGAPLDESFAPGSSIETARLKQNHFYASIRDGARGVRIAGWLENGPADLILLTDRSRVVRGLGGFFGGLRPKPFSDESFFVAFAPESSLADGFDIWAVRGGETRRVIPRLTVPRLDPLDKPED